MATKQISSDRATYVSTASTRNGSSNKRTARGGDPATQPPKIDPQHASQERVQVAFRIEKEAYREIKRMALDADITINELMLLAINELRERKGLKKLPRPPRPESRESESSA